MQKEFKFEIGNSSTGDIGAVFYVKAATLEDARAKLKEYIGHYGEPIRDLWGSEVEILIYFGTADRVSATKDAEECE